VRGDAEEQRLNQQRGSHRGRDARDDAEAEYVNPFLATEPRARLGAKLAEIAPGDIDRFFFTNGGAEPTSTQSGSRGRSPGGTRSWHGTAPTTARRPD